MNAQSSSPSPRPRPSAADDDILEEAAKLIVEELIREYGEGIVEGEKDLATEQITEAIGYSDDGYKICRDLESEGWDPDARMVAIFDDVSVHKRRVLDERVKAWVAAEGVTPEFKVGDRVQFYRHNPKVGLYDGEIVKVYPDRAEYVIEVKSLGHVRTGAGVHGLVIPFENCSPLPATQLAQPGATNAEGGGT